MEKKNVVGGTLKYCSFSLAMYIFSTSLTFCYVLNFAAPSGPPENFEVKPLRGKGTAVSATWDPPDEPNGKIRGEALSTHKDIMQSVIWCIASFLKEMAVKNYIKILPSNK